MRRRDAQLLKRALGVEQVPGLATALRSIGGAAALFYCGVEPVRGLLSPEEIRRLEAWLTLTERMLAAEVRPGIEGPGDVLAYLGRGLLLSAREQFWTVMLDARGRGLGKHRAAEGTLTACMIHPREIFAPAIRARAASLILVHNHPSGDPSPSPEDLRLTDRMADAGQLLGIPVLDHLIVARGGIRSLVR